MVVYLIGFPPDSDQFLTAFLEYYKAEDNRVVMKWEFLVTEKAI